MRSQLLAVGFCQLLLASGLAVPEPQPEPEQLAARAPTCNTPSNRACWTSGFNINTDWEASVPTTGVTRTVWSPCVFVRDIYGANKLSTP